MADAAKIASGIWTDLAKETSSYPNLQAAFGSGSAFKATDFVDAHSDRLKEIDTEISAALAEYSKVESL